MLGGEGAWQRSVGSEYFDQAGPFPLQGEAGSGRFFVAFELPGSRCSVAFELPDSLLCSVVTVCRGLLSRPFLLQI